MIFLYSIVLIDDEFYTVNNIKSSIDWEEFGFYVVRLFSDSENALDYIKNNPVDVIITDIRMPLVTGVDIAKYCYYNKPKTKVVFLSGYADFEYAQEGIKYQVFEYITKPVSVNDIHSLLLKLSTQLQNSTHYSQNFINNELKSDIRNHILKYLLESDSSEASAITDLIGKFNIKVNFEKAAFSLISFQIENTDLFYQNEWKYGNTKLVSSLEQLINSAQSKAYVSLSHFYEIGFDIFMISAEGVNLEDFTVFSDTHITALIDALKVCLHMNAAISNKSVSDDINVIRKIISDNYSQIQPGNVSDKESALISAREYIDTHYREKLTLNDVSRIANFHPRYFSQLFSDYYGINFSDYLSNVRLDRAKDLLINTDTKITNIPYLIGLQHLTNFSKRFKEYTGYSPSEYKAKYGKK